MMTYLDKSQKPPGPRSTSRGLISLPGPPWQATCGRQSTLSPPLARPPATLTRPGNFVPAPRLSARCSVPTPARAPPLVLASGPDLGPVCVSGPVALLAHASAAVATTVTSIITVTPIVAHGKLHCRDSIPKFRQIYLFNISFPVNSKLCGFTS